MELSFFEFTVAMAFDYFAKQKVDVAIIETGLGGRLDSTNIINPELAIITNISLDHTNLLGDTIEKIATEKAGIIKNKTPLIIGRRQKETTSIFENTCKERNSNLIYASPKNNYASDLKGEYQKENINTVIEAIKQLQKIEWVITEDNIRNGLLKTVANTKLLGRWQSLSKNPQIICDTAHNEDGIKEIAKQLRNSKYKQLHIVFGTVDDKDLDTILPYLPKDAKYYFCSANVLRAMNTENIKQKADEYKLIGQKFASVSEALKYAKEDAHPADLIFIGGSTFVVAEVI